MPNAVSCTGSSAECSAVPPFEAATGTLLQQLVLAAGPLTVLQIGCPYESFTARLAAAVSENGQGRVICCEPETVRAEAAAAAVEKAGLGRYADVRVGRPERSLATVPGPVDLLLFGGSPESFLPLLKLLEPRMLPGAVVVAHGERDVPALCTEFLDHVRFSGSGYVSLPLPFDGGVEMAVRAA
ncbi:O-methyltransferase [Streptomyces sp. AK010]|uniref:O-methyltransferase n=1 Tax=Streptomyces sp. AK010 TaxID=2723074 RepID=UPI0016123EF7|nr:class I SAM-dependent methyltransferase [Streptomyces sp. AK010]MBB6418518.1 putative O-methyltransferase YrrM [Streptomyces sp. AK010]